MICCKIIEMIKTYTTNSGKQTEDLGQKIGRALKGGEVIELISDLGGGKTTFTRGLVKGAGSSDHVSSPTFTISNVYNGANVTLAHFDFYRLPAAGLMEHELEDVLDEPDKVVIVEWSDVVAHVLPKERLIVKIISGKDEEERTLTLSWPEKLNYLVAGL